MSNNNCKTINCEFVEKLSPGLKQEMLQNHQDFDYVTCCPEVFNLNTNNNMNHNKASDTGPNTVIINNYYGDNYYNTYNYYSNGGNHASGEDHTNNQEFGLVTFDSF